MTTTREQALANALSLAIATIERLTVKHGPFTSTGGTIDVARTALAMPADTVNADMLAALQRIAAADPGHTQFAVLAISEARAAIARATG